MQLNLRSLANYSDVARIQTVGAQHAVPVFQSPKNGDCHQFAPHHSPRSKTLSLKRIGWLYSIFRDVCFYHGLRGTKRKGGQKPALKQRVGRSPLRNSAVILLAIFGAGFSGLSTAEEEAGKRLLSLRLVPERVTLGGVRAQHRFLVLGTYADGLQRDVTLQSRFSVSDPAVATVGEGARVLALADGQAVLKAELEGQVASANVRIEGSEDERPFSFTRDIGAVLTKRGCNSSECHGAVKGKGGFKLSLNGRSPQDDYRWIVDGERYHGLVPSSGPKNPRVNTQQPEKSLLLLKPTLTVAHGGGKRFEVGSSDYQAILNWARGGVPYGGEDGQRGGEVDFIEVFPKEALLDLAGKQQLLVTARLSNGWQEDITEHVRYVSNNPEVVEVTPEGLVKGVKRGETAVIIRAVGHAASARVGVIARPILNYPDVPRGNLIDDHVFSKLRRFHIIPSELSSDAEFLRRVCLDVTGTLPPPERVREFLGSRDPQKREKLIDILLDSPEYVDYWTFQFAEFFRVMWSNASTYRTWIRESIAQNKPYDQMARERVSAQGVDGPARHYLKRTGEILLPEDTMVEDIRVFMGLRMDCAQCHNHPYEVWTQDQFWGMTAFYGQVSRVRDVGMIFDDPLGHGERREPRVLHPRTHKEAQPRFLDGALLPESEQADPTMRLAAWVTSPNNPYFAKVIVNRMWAYFLGRGLVDPVDDFRSANPPTHPGLLEALARDFEKHGYDLKHLMRLIIQSRTYQLSADGNETNKDDEINHSRALPRRLEAEILLDAISRVTGVEESFVIDHYVGGGKELPGTRAIHLIPESSPTHFLDVYGRQPLRETIPVRERQANLGQALHMLAGPTYTSKISQAEGRLDRLLKDDASDEQIIEELYLAALSRFPTDRELAELGTAIRELPSRRKGMEALVWGLIASREFTYNH